MKLFEVQTDLTSFTYPIVKITICLLIIVLCLARNRLFYIPTLWINAIITALGFLLLIASILCLYISIGELFHTYTNRKKINYQSIDVKHLSIEEITKIVSENNIVEIEVCTNNKTIKIGASSECKHSSFVFEDKQFYVSSCEYETISQFREALFDLFPKGIIPVSRIDGLPLKYWNR